MHPCASIKEAASYFFSSLSSFTKAWLFIIEPKQPPNLKPPLPNQFNPDTDTYLAPVLPFPWTQHNRPNLKKKREIGTYMISWTNLIICLLHEPTLTLFFLKPMWSVTFNNLAKLPLQSASGKNAYFYYQHLFFLHIYDISVIIHSLVSWFQNLPLQGSLLVQHMGFTQASEM